MGLRRPCCIYKIATAFSQDVGYINWRLRKSFPSYAKVHSAPILRIDQAARRALAGQRIEYHIKLHLHNDSAVGGVGGSSKSHVFWATLRVWVGSRTQRVGCSCYPVNLFLSELRIYDCW